MSHHRIVVWSCVVMLGAASPASAQVPPERSRETFATAPGFQVQLFAHEPMVVNPTSLDVDHLGRVWVAEAVNYRRINFGRPILRPEGDRLVVLLDEKGEGKADRAVTFYQGPELYGPLSVCVLPQTDGRSLRVLVAQSPDILEFWDRDGDLKADGPPTRFLTGFGGFDHDHGVHGLHIGPDGKLYFTVGDSGVGQGRDRDGRPIPPLQGRDAQGRKWVSNATDCRAGTVWRCNLDGSHLELVAHNFRNNYEACVDSFGEIWLSDNDDDGNQQTRVCFVLPGGNYGYHPRGPGQSHWHEEQPGIVHKVLRTGFGSPTGIQFYEGTLFGARYGGALLHADAGPREVRAFFRKPKGAGFELEKEVLLTSRDTWFRPSDVCVAPDGSIFVADWYDPGVGGHGMGDWTRGRIYRLTPQGHLGYRISPHDVKTSGGLAAALQSPCIAERTLALLRLSELGEGHEHYENAVQASLLAGNVPQSAEPWLVGRAMWLRQRKLRESLGRYDRPAAPGDLSDKIACQRLRQFARQYPQLGPLTDDHKQRLHALIEDFTPAVRRELALALQHAEPDLVREFFAPLAEKCDSSDHFYRAALNIACGTDPARREAILADFHKHFAQWDDRVASLVWELRPATMLPKVEARLAQEGLSLDERLRLLDILAVYDDSKAGRILLHLLTAMMPDSVYDKALSLLRVHLPNRWRDPAHSKDLREVIDRLWSQPESRLRGLQVIAAVRYAPSIESVARVAQDRSAPTQWRREAIRALAELPHDAAVTALVELLGQTADDDRLEVIKAIGASLNRGISGEAAAKAFAALQDLVLATKPPKEVQVAAVETLASTRIGTDWLLTLKESGRMPEPVVRLAGRLLRNSPFQAQRHRAMLLFPAPGKLDPGRLPPISQLARQRGDAQRGQQLILSSRTNETQCLKCHSIRGLGGHVGPDLSMIGLKASRENLLESILEPSKAIADQFAQYTIETKTGQVVTGLLVGQSDDRVILRDANGKDHAFTAADVESLSKSAVSLMPADIVKAFTEEELLDVVEYLLTLRSPAYTPTNWHLVGPFRAKSMLDGLEQTTDVERSPFDGNDTFTENGQRVAVVAARAPGRLAWKIVPPDASGYVDLAARHGAEAHHSFSYAWTAVQSPKDQDAAILLGSDDGAKLFINGELVFTVRETRAAQPNQNRVPIRLKKGRNTILLKVANGDGPHGFYLTIESSDELKEAPLPR